MTKNLLQRVIIIIAWLSVCSILQAEENREFWVFDSSNGLADNSAQTIMCTKTGRMVISTIGHINFYDGNTFAHVDPKPDDVFALPKYNGHYHLYFDRHHHIWLKDRQSVTCLDLLMERFISDVGGVFAELGMTKPVDDMFGDQNFNLWFRSADSLYNIELACRLPIRHESDLIDVDVYHRELVLLFYADGITRAFDLKTGHHKFDTQAFNRDEATLYSRSGVLCPHADGFYQIRNGDERGILLNFDVKTRKWTVMMEQPYHLNNMVEYEGRLYVASAYGYWVYDLKTGEKEHVSKLTLSKGRTLETDVNTLAFDRQGGMWIGTERRGLLYAKPYTSPFNAYSWSDPLAMKYFHQLEQALGPASGRLERRLNCVYEDSRGWTWKGTYTGLILEKSESARPQVFTKRHGLSNEVIHCVIEDANHDIWVGTSYGIAHLFIAADSVTHIESYTASDNVPAEIFVNGRAYCADDGTIIMQSIDHMVVFNPASFHYVQSKSMEIPPKLVRVMVNGTTVEAGMELDGQVVIDRAVTRVKEINVNYDQNSVSLTFSALNYFRPSQTYYRVRVKGVSGLNDWIVLSQTNSGGRVDKHGMLHLQLMGIRPGRYEVELQSSMSSDTWNVEPFVWVVNVEEPWWRSAWSYLLLALLVFSLLTANFIVYNRNLKMLLKRNNDEIGIMRLLRNYADRCSTLAAEMLTADSSTEQKLDDSHNISEFLDVMELIVPYMNSHKGQSVTMRDLATLVGRRSTDLYSLLSGNLHQNPYLLMKRLHLQEAAKLLKNTQLNISEIAEQCKFASPNYFIASFYHQYRQTPKDYRNSAAR